MRKRRAWAAAAIVILVGSGGCGAGDDPTLAPAASPSTTAPPTTAGPTTPTTPAPAPSETTATAPPGRTVECGTVGFTPNSEDAASDITATGLDCAEARAFVEQAGRRTSSGGPAALEVAGFRCVRTRAEEDPLPVAHYRCTSGDRTVTFARS